MVAPALSPVPPVAPAAAQPGRAATPAPAPTPMRTFRNGLLLVQYPFDHAERDISIGSYFLPDMPLEDNHGEQLAAADRVLEYAPTLYHRILARLAHRAECVETGLGLPPLAEPPEDDDPPERDT